MAVPSASIWKKATRRKPRTALIMHAIAIKISGLFEFPSPLKIPLIALYPVINGIPQAQINIYCIVASIGCQ